MSEDGGRLLRFSRAERWSHRSIAFLMFVLFATAAALYIPDISAIVGNRQVVRCPAQRGVAAPVRGIGQFRIVIEKLGHAVLLTQRDGGKEIDAGPPGQQQLDHLLVPVARRIVQWPHPVVIPSVDVGPGVQQQSRHLSISVDGRIVQRRVAIGRLGMNVCLGGEQCPGPERT